MTEFKVTISGHRPVPWGCNEWEWRKVISDAVKAQKTSNPVLAQKTDQFSVNLVFKIKQERVSRPDLDNLAKPVLDTLFLPFHPQVKDLSITGALFNIDDNAVFRLYVEKIKVTTVAEEGIDIVVTW
jgi:Holliday junction resolvase RusA-like endonuclease